MGLAHSPRIVTDGLVLCLDAANPKSYPGSGTACSDLSSYSNNGVLYNQTYYDSNTKSFVFDGDNDYIEVADSPSVSLTGDMSICSWINVTNFSSYRGIVGKTTPAVPAPIDYYLLSSSGLARFMRGNGSSYNYVNATNAPATGVWQYISVTMSGTNVYHYLNGNSNGSGTLISSISDGNGTLRIGNRGDLVTDYLGKLSQISIYNKALTDEEIKQNFNALRGRYGL